MTTPRASRTYAHRMAAGRARRTAAVVALAILAVTASAARADIYRKIDKQGQMHLTDSPEGPGWVLVMRTSKSRRSATGGNGARAKTRAANLERNRARHSPLIVRAARRYRFDPALIHAIVQAESAYDSKAVSHKGAMGLMQLMPATAKRFGVTDAYDPEQNVMAGTRYLRWLYDKFQNTYLALAGYNAGEQSVIKYGNKVPPYPETQAYVRKVHLYWKERRTQLASAKRSGANARNVTTAARLARSKQEMEAARKEMRERMARSTREMKVRATQ